MSFRVSARTIIQLGAELISSDAVALLELIKNAFDAGSRRVSISVVVRIPFALLKELQAETLDATTGRVVSTPTLESIKRRTIDAIDPTSPHSASLRRSVGGVDNVAALQTLLRESNHLTVSDTGEGMSLDTLDDVFLTIGTRSRLKIRAQRVTNGMGRPVRRAAGAGGGGRQSAVTLTPRQPSQPRSPR